MQHHSISSNPPLPPALLESVLARLGLSRAPEATLDGLRLIFDAWCRKVPFDNVRKLIHVRAGSLGPLPGHTPEDFFAGWLKFGTGGTCWSNAGALHALLASLGFQAVRGIGTMLAAPNLPPNHGTARVSFDGAEYLVDGSIMHGEPLRLLADAPTSIDHPAWGVQCARKDDRWHIAWRPLHRFDVLECRLESFGASAADYHSRYDVTRGWSPFNFEVTARLNRGDQVIGVSFGHAVTLRADGAVDKAPVPHKERLRLLIEDLGLSEELVRQLPEDVPTPPPPGSQTALATAS